jgi:DNA invertase Pin-like site-specific DNA recombinase
MLKRLKTGEVAGVIMHKIDRSARNLKDWAELGQLIDQGVEVHFSNETVDLNSRGGRLSADIQAVVAADVASQPNSIPITPQRRRRAARTRLAQRTNAVVARILKDLKLSAAGFQIGKPLGISGRNNRAAVTQLLNTEINSYAGIGSGSRNNLTAKQSEDVFGQLDNLGDVLLNKIRLTLSGEKDAKSKRHS